MGGGHRKVSAIKGPSASWQKSRMQWVKCISHLREVNCANVVLLEIIYT